MARVVAGITVSLDGYITGPNDRLGAGLGEGGERLHDWVFGGPWTYDGVRGAPSDVDEPDRTRDAGTHHRAVPVRVLRQVLLVVRLGVVERSRFRDLGRDPAVAGA